MNRFKNLALLGLTLALTGLLSCKKDALQGNASTLVGTWNWLFVGGGFSGGGNGKNPSTEGYTLRLELTADGNYTLYKSSKQIEHGRVRKSGDAYGLVSDDLRKRDNILAGQYITRFDDENLYIEDAPICYDCFYYVFKKAP